MAELEELEQEELDEKLLDVGPTATDKLPSVPTDPVASSKYKERQTDTQTRLRTNIQIPDLYMAEWIEL